MAINMTRANETMERLLTSRPTRLNCKSFMLTKVRQADYAELNKFYDEYFKKIDILVHCAVAHLYAIPV
jgi:hypothetical protein